MRSFEQKLVVVYPTLSAKLKEAADFVAAHPVEVATRSLRSLSADAGLAPVTFTRMARAIGYDDYEELRDNMRATVSEKANSFSDGVARLQNDHVEGRKTFIQTHLTACAENLNSTLANVDERVLVMVVKHLYKARQVQVMGALGSTGIAEYFVYMANFIKDNWSLAGRMGASLGSMLIGLGKQDVLIVITKPPFARSSIQAAKVAREKGVYVVVITNTHTCPALREASNGFILPTKSPHFFSSYVATMAFVEAIICMLAAKCGDESLNRIAKIEGLNDQLEYIQST